MIKSFKQQEGIFYWTKHSLAKLKEYNLSQQRVRRILHHPSRTEVGIVPETWASMQIAGSKKHPYEIWVMYEILTQGSKFKKQNNIQKKKDSQVQNLETQNSKNAKNKRIKNNNSLEIVSTLIPKHIKQIKIISAWKYPGVTKPGEPIPIPLDILEEIMNNHSN